MLKLVNGNNGGITLEHNAEIKKEQQRVDEVIKNIDDQIKRVKEALQAAHKETRAVEKNYGENASINRYEIDDIAESRSAIEQQRRLVAQATENEDILKRQLATLQELRKSPYFGRIDIREGNGPSESLYIGVASLMNDDKTDFLVYDWRAPISSIYYNGTLGNVTYQTPAGPRQCQLVKKRQFTIINGQITNMFDTNETVGDELLQQALGQQNDQSMQNIVATIQKEQNDIIRNTNSDLLIVQGVAGSGKTSTILQRIAYLLYHAKESLNADQIVLFSPNLLFSQYISKVLPSLGERNMRQVTLAGFLKRRFEGLDVETIFERYEKATTPTYVQNYLESAHVMRAVEGYLTLLKNNGSSLYFQDITFHQKVFFSAKEISTIYSQQPQTMPVADRLTHTKNVLIRKLQKRSKAEAHKDWVQRGLNSLDLQQLHKLMGKRSVDDFVDKQAQARYLARRYAHNQLRIVADAIYNNYFIDFYQQYQDFLAHLKWPANIDQATQELVIKEFAHDIEFHQLHLVHTTPLMYLRDLISGAGQNRSFQYVFIDEMQDYSPALLIYLRHAFPGAKFTILGDSEQALFYPLQLPEELLNQLADDLQAHHPRLITLRQSYRSTTEITNFAKALLPDGDKIHAFSRHGEKVHLTMTYNEDDWEQQLQVTVDNIKQEYPNLAVLTRNQEQAKNTYHVLYQHVSKLHRLTSKTTSLPQGVVILPAYLAKGLEFDAVIIADVSQNGIGERGSGLLYTMATRAMHYLAMLSKGPTANCFTDSASKQLVITHQLIN